MVDKTYGEDFIVTSPQSLALGDNGSIHSVYSVAGEIIYFYHDKWIWNKEVVATTESLNNYPSIVVDKSGNPHFSYFNNKELWYAYKNISVFLDDDISEAKASLALDSTNNPHISYYSSLEEDEGSFKNVLMYAYKDSLRWHYEIVDVAGEQFIAGSIALALDRSDNPHIIFGRRGYVYKDSSGWHVENLDDVVSGTIQSLALDTDHHPTVSTSDGVNDLIQYAYKDTAGWHAEIVFDSIGSVNVGRRLAVPAIALDTNNGPHISYGYSTYACSPGGLLLPCIFSGSFEYVKKNSLGWHRRTLDKTYGYGVSFGPSLPLTIIQFYGRFGLSSITVDLNANPHVLYTLDLSAGFFNLNLYRSDKLKHAYTVGVPY